MELETKRLLLRQWRDEDAPRLYELARAPEIGLPAGWPPHTSVEHSLEVLHTALAGEDVFAVVLKETGEVIGSIGMCQDDVSAPEYEIGYWVGRAYWGHGYIPEAVEALLARCFTVLDQRRVWCAHYEGNAKSKRVIEKCGFTFQFSRRADVPLLGETRTECRYALTRETWEKRQ